MDSGGGALSLFVLREGYRVVSTSAGGRLVREGEERGIELTPAEVTLLARASAGGLSPEDPAVAPIVEKLRALGALVPLSPRPGAAGAEPPSSRPPLAAPDERATVPLFRRDLRIEPSPTSNSVFRVTGPSGRTFSLYDFELSLARMLDGERRYFEAVDAGQRLGIPVSLESLAQYIRELGSYGFLQPPDEPASEKWDGERSTRRQWDDSMRTLFQSGLRLTRQGRYAEATSYFEAMLAQEPETPEALEMLTRVQQRLSSGANPLSKTTKEMPAVAPSRFTTLELTIDEQPPIKEVAGADLLPEVTSPPEIEPAAPQTAMAPTDEPEPPPEEPAEPPPPEKEAAESTPEPSPEDEFFEEPGSEHLTEEIPTEVSQETVEPRRRPRWGMRILLGVVVVAAAGAVLLFVFPRTTGGAKHTTSPGTDSGTGTVAASTSTDAGSAVAPPPADARAAAEVDAGTRTSTHSQAEPAVDAGAPVATQETPPEPAIPWISAPVTRPTRAIQAKLKANGAGILTWSVPRGQVVRRGEPLAKILRKPGGATVKELRASKPGLLLPTVAEGRRVKPGQLVGTLSKPQGTAQALIKGQRPKPGWRCEVVDPKQDAHAPCQIRSASPKGKGVLVTVVTEAPWLDQRGLQVRIAPKK
jgi:hypothetical protein